MYQTKKDFMENRNRIYNEDKTKTELKEKILINKWKTQSLAKKTYNMTSLNNTYNNKPLKYLDTHIPNLPNRPPSALSTTSTKTRPIKFMTTLKLSNKSNHVRYICDHAKTIR